MGKIRKHFSQDKHGATLSPYISDFVTKGASLPVNELREHLAQFPHDWPFPRGDLYHWIPLLNRFDDVFEQLIKVYSLDLAPQTVPFTGYLVANGLQESEHARPSADELLQRTQGRDDDGLLAEDIVWFTRLLHENCGNRSLYASSGRLNDLLNTSSLSLLEKTLRLAHRLAQRYTASRMRSAGASTHLGHVSQSLLAAHYAINLSRLEDMSYPLALATLEDSELAVENADRTLSHLKEVTGRARLPSLGTNAELLGDGPLPTEELKSIVEQVDGQLSSDESKSRSWALMHVMRLYKGILESPENRQRIIAIRLLAIANLAQIYPENTLQDKALCFYADKPRHVQFAQELCELVRPAGRKVHYPQKIQTLALLTLESLMNHRSKGSEVSTALNISVSHGPLASTLRHAVNEITSDAPIRNAEEESDWLAELFTLMHALVKHNGRTFDGLLSAGLIDMLVEIIKSRSSKAERRHAPALSFLTVFLYSTNDAFGTFITANGLDAVSSLLDYQTRKSIDLIKAGKGFPAEYKTQMTDYQIPFVQQQCIRGILKFVNSILGMAGGPFDRHLRNLIESSVFLGSLQILISCTNMFGSNIWGNCIGIFSIFINNEPTSYNAIAEAGIPKAVLWSITRTEEAAQPVESAPTPINNAGGILPVGEAINAIPDAFAAMCLNESGKAQLEKSDALDVLFNVFVSPAHVNALDGASSHDIERFANAIDQLYRHNPFLSDRINKLALSAAARVSRLIKRAPVGGMLADSFVEKFFNSEDVDMEAEPIDGKSDKYTLASTYERVICRFLSIVMGRSKTFCSAFLDAGGLEHMLTIASAPGLVRDGHGGDSLAFFPHIVKHMADDRPALVVPAVIGTLQKYIDKVKPIAQYDNSKPCTLPFTSAKYASQLEGKERDRVQDLLLNLAPITCLLTCLNKILVYQTTPAPVRNSPPNTLTIVNVGDLLWPLIDSLAELQRKMMWEYVVFNDMKDKPMDTEGPGLGLPIHSAMVKILDDPYLNLEHGETPILQFASLILRCRQAIYEDSMLLFARIGGSIMPRRLTSEPYPYQRQQVIKVGEHIAQAVIKMLSFEFPPGTPRERIALYRRLSIEEAQKPLVGWFSTGWPPRALAMFQTVAVSEFQKQGGMQVIGEHLTGLLAEIVQRKADKDTRPSTSQLGGDDPMMALGHYVHFLSVLVDRKAVLESSHTAALNNSREHRRDNPDFFAPGQLLLELRYHSLKALLRIWNSEDLHALSSDVVRSMAKVLLAIIDGQGEGFAFKRSDRVPKPIRPEHRRWSPRRDLLESITEQGVPENLAVEALYRCFNGLVPAGEYCAHYADGDGYTQCPPSPDEILVIHNHSTRNSSPQPSDLGPADRATERSESVRPEVDAREVGDDEEVGNLLEELVDVVRSTLDQSTAPPPLETSAPVAPGQIVVEDLDELRAQVRANLMDRCLSIAGSFNTVVFEISDLIVASAQKAPDQSDVTREYTSTLVLSLVSYSGNDNLTSEASKVAAIGHLLGIVLQREEFFATAKEELASSVSSLVSLLVIPNGAQAAAAAPWIPSILLILERILSEYLTPVKDVFEGLSADNAGGPQPSMPQPDELVSLDDRKALFEKICDLLPRVGKDMELGDSIARILVILTRNSELAQSLADKRNMQKFLVMVKQLSTLMIDRFRGSIMIILRHLIEDEEIVRKLMRSDITDLMETVTRPIDSTRFVRDLYHAVLRDPQTFVQVAGEATEISRLDRNQGPQILSLKKSESSQEQPAAETSRPEADDIVPSAEKVSEQDAIKADVKPPIVENPDGVIHFLLCELLTYKEVEDKRPTEEKGDQAGSDVEMTTEETASAPPKKEAKEEFKPDEHPIYIYRCFILQCLRELFASYNKTKVEFINFSRKAEPQASTPSKPRSGILNYMLNSLLPTGNMEHPSTLEQKKRASTSNCAISAIVALCARTTEIAPIRDRRPEPEDEADLTFVRRFVLEHAIRAFRDCQASTEPDAAKYSKLLALADLFNRMMAPRVAGHANVQRSSGAEDNLIPTNKQAAKIMFDKNLIATLTHSLSDIDPNLTYATRLIKYIVRPLKLLTHTAIEISLSSDTPSPPGNTSDEDDISSATSMSDVGDVREETPDLFRNSTLGMFEPGREDEPTSSDDDDDDEEEELYEDEYGDEMDYDEQEEGSGGDVVSEEDEDMEGMGPVEGLSGDMGIDVEIEMDGSHSDDSSGHEHDEDDEDMDEDEDEEDMDDLDQEEIEDEIEEDDGASLGDQPPNGAWMDDEHDDGHSENGLDSFPDDNEGLAHPGLVELATDGGDLAVDLESGEDDDEDDEDDFDEEVLYNEAEDEDNDLPPMIFNPWPDTPARRVHGTRTGFIPRIDDLTYSGDPIFGNERLRASGRGNEANEAQNALLTRDRRPAPSGPRHGLWPPHSVGMPFSSILPRPEEGGAVDADNYQYLTSLINALGRGAPSNLMQTIHHHQHHGTGAIQFRVGTSGQAGDFMEVRIQGGPSELPHLPPPPGPQSQDPLSAVNFAYSMTYDRWQEEARIIFGSAYHDRALRVAPAILRLLVPPAIVAENVRRQKAAEEAQKAEEETRAEKERQEEEERRMKEIADREALERAAAEPSEPTSEAMEVTETPSDEQPPEPPASSDAARVFTIIRGQRLDITDLGIDPAYLEALPEDMREEVIMSQFAAHRSQAAASGNDSSTYDNEFLEALPPDIREEILLQERQDRRRRERDEHRRRAAQAAQPGQAPQAEEMDTASFMATLDPALRQQLLAEADEDVIASLPPDIAAEARALMGQTRRRDVDPTRLIAEIGQLGGSASRNDGEDRAPNKAVRRPIVQMLDRNGIFTLLRLMFFTIQSNARHTLHGILRNICGNYQTRSEIVSGLLHILQEGSSDQAAVEKSYQHLSNRVKQTVIKSPSKSSLLEEVPKTTATPSLLIGNCLSSLIFLTHAMPHIPKFFLTEHEVAGGLKSKSKSKGKGRETRASRIPLNALLDLLDRENVIDNPQLIERLAGLLQSVTQPLPGLLKREKEATEAKKDKPEDEKSERKPFNAPDVPESSLRLIINILVARDCNGKTFRDTLSTINNLSAIPGAREAFGAGLVQTARDIGREIVKDLAQLKSDFKRADDEMEAQNMALSKFSPSESAQSKLNRVLTALHYLFDAKVADTKDASSKHSSGLLPLGWQLVNGLHEDRIFSTVWSELSDTLTTAHEVVAKGQQSDKTYLNVATILLPLIESLMVICKRLDLKDARSINIGARSSAPATPAVESPMKIIFFTFTNKHRKILNDLVRHSPKLMSGSFSVLVKNSSVLEFDNKRNYFSRKLHHRTMDVRQYPHPTLQCNVRREFVFTDSYRSLYFKKPEEMKYGKLNVRFHGEEGVDAGGVTREWFQVLSRQMFDPSWALFNPVASDRTTFHPNPLSAINESHLNYFHFIGRIIGKALYENRVLDCHFSRAVYKRILGKQVSLKDMETIDLDYTKSLQWMLDNDITDIITETFSITADYFGSEEIIDLIENGRNVPVTDENKHEYVRLVIEYKLTGSVKDQLDSFLKGFHDIVPPDLISIFDEGELELLISGMPEIDIFDWKNNTDYQNYTANSPQIQWFWRAVRSFDKEERAKLLQFVTGTGKVPLNGFKELEGMNGFTRFSIHKDYGNKDRLPSSHTCFNQYDSYESLRKSLYTAMTTGGEYFGFA